MPAPASSPATPPIRTCVGCRTRVPAAELVRLVVVDEVVVVDVEHRLPGRGAHLHPGPACVAVALKRRALPRALRAPQASTQDLPAHPAFADSQEPASEG